MENVKIDYIKIATMNRLKNSQVFSKGYTFETNKENSLEYIINLTENTSNQSINWLVSIPVYNTCFLLPTSTITIVDIEEQLQNTKHSGQDWNRELAESIYYKIQQILNET
ncbi:hypothetical protein M3936_19150 [Sutcliffiella horikoshii]|uniref:hypothetical protein n=1 Tax=Sutcliffiella horikoshii TaxID=79883 RepID=UPI0020415A22|nr:hypothetical protein [Sutcliffiella horikoshii]MCM3619691.1 hypothetical protein [Sutcliffiella horikoshii]